MESLTLKQCYKLPHHPQVGLSGILLLLDYCYDKLIPNKMQSWIYWIITSSNESIRNYYVLFLVKAVIQIIPRGYIFIFLFMFL